MRIGRLISNLGEFFAMCMLCFFALMAFLLWLCAVYYGILEILGVDEPNGAQHIKVGEHADDGH